MSEGKERINYSTGSPWETLRGFSRAVKVGDSLFVSGTTAINEKGEVIGVGDAYQQTRYVLDKIKRIVQNAGFKNSDIVRTRMFVTDLSRWDDYARAHREVFDSIRPVSAITQVSRLTDPRLLVEIEADAILGCELKESVKLQPQP